MSHKSIGMRLRLAMFGSIICLGLMYFYVWCIARYFFESKPEEFTRTVAWCLTVGGTIIPFIPAFIRVWQISVLVNLDKTFSKDTAKALSGISNCAFIQGIYLLIGKLTLIIIGFSDPNDVFVILILVMLAFVAGLVFAVLARFVQKAAELQEESDLTV